MSVSLAVRPEIEWMEWHGSPAHVPQNTGKMPVPLRPATSTIRAILPLAFLTLLFFAPQLRAETIVNVPTAPGSDVSIRLSAPWTQVPRFGFAPVRVTIENRSRSERTWQVNFEAGQRGTFPGASTTSESISVGAGQTRDAWVFVPIAEPGMNMLPTGAGTRVAPPVVKIETTPKGRKVTRTRTLRNGTVNIVETEIDTTTATVTTTTTLPSGARSSRTSTNSMNEGTTVIFTINPTTGTVNTATRLRSPDSTGPARVEIVTGPGAPGAIATPVVPASAFASATVNLFAEVSGAGVLGGRQYFPNAPSGNGMRPFAVSPSLEAAFRAKLSPLMAGAPNLSIIEVADLPADWRVWSSFSGVLLTTDEYAGLDAARRSALRAWVALGGQLCLAPGLNPSTSGSGSLRAENLGAGSIVVFPGPLEALAAGEFLGPAGDLPRQAGQTEAERAAAFRAEIEARRAARGGVTTIAAEVELPAEPDETGLPEQVQLFAGTAALPDRDMLALTRGTLFEAVKEEPLDNAWLGVFLVIFAVVVGPVNLFIFAPANQRHRLFVTTPVLAVAASLILGIVILAQDGTGGAGERRTCVALLPGENSAAIVQEQAARTGFLTRGSFALPDDVAFTVLPLEPIVAFGGPENSFERRRGTASGDWFQSRARQAHQLRRIVPTRARVEAVGVAPDGAPIVQSSLGTTLRQFTYIDAAGKNWRTPELPSGQRVTLQPGASALPPLMDEGSANLRRVARASLPDGTAERNRWSALGGTTDLAPIPTLSSIRWKDSNVSYTGALENAAAGTGGETTGAKGGGR